MSSNAESEQTKNTKSKSLWRKTIDWWKKGRLIAFVILLALCVVKASELTPGGPINSIRESTLLPLQSYLFDTYQRLKPREIPKEQDRPVVIVDIDDESLAEIGQWPWPRDLLADMLKAITNSGALSVGFDVVFAEEDRLSPNLVASRASARNLDKQTIDKLLALPSNDAIFANVLKSSKVVLGQAARGDIIPGQRKGLPKAPPLARKGAKPFDFFSNEYAAVLRNFPILEKASPGLGVLNVEPDKDGVVRRAPAVILVKYTKKNGKVRKKIYPSLVLEMYRQAMAKARSPLVIFSTPLGMNKVAVTKDYSIPTEPNGEIWVYYAKPGEQTNDLYVSAKDILSGLLPPETFANKFVLFGTSAVGLRDIRSTPISNNLPGVEVHANMVETIWFNTPLTRGDSAAGVEITIALLTGLLLIILLPWIGAGWSLILAGIVTTILVTFSWLSFAGLNFDLVGINLPGRQLVDFTFFAITILILYSYLTYTSFSATSAEKKQVRGAFSQYLSPALVEQLADEPDKLTLGGEMKSMTFLFCDVRGFTSISETFKTNPQGLTSLINKFLTPMTDIIMDRKGTIDKYMGDCIMAFWNAPLDDSEHPANAGNSALAMFEHLPLLNTQLEKEANEENRDFHPVRIGIGINTGECVVGNMGSDKRFDYSVLGDPVNLAARLEGQSKNYGVDIVIGEETEKVLSEWATIELDLIAVKGKAEAVRIFALMGDIEKNNSPEFKDISSLNEKMLSSYRAKDWDNAELFIKENLEKAKISNIDLSVLYDLYLERIASYRQNPPPEQWDGVFVATSK
ncbi:adenylate/guanylate cyclase domain-containing protein [Alphaproteobacteria bacterium]|nr:adenylate/guanylate cyclase domain-containing protein [Alphaproteobacteria bacterium]